MDISRGDALQTPGADPAQTWPTAQAIQVVGVGGLRPRDALVPLVQGLVRRFGTGIIVSATRPPAVLRQWLLDDGVREHDVRYLDCVSAAVGLPASDDGRTIVMPGGASRLELVALRCEQWLERLHGRRFVLVDSLSTLAVLNGVGPVAAFVEDLAVRLRRQRAPAALLLDDGQVPALREAVRPLVDGETTLRPAALS